MQYFLFIPSTLFTKAARYRISPASMDFFSFCNGFFSLYEAALSLQYPAKLLDCTFFGNTTFVSKLFLASLSDSAVIRMIAPCFSSVGKNFTVLAISPVGLVLVRAGLFFAPPQVTVAVLRR